jgi:hypothetical protein
MDSRGFVIVVGDSVTTEIMARRHRGLLPAFLQEEINGVIFTNGRFYHIILQFSRVIIFQMHVGGMQIALSNFRISQSLLKSPFGPFFAWLVGTIDPGNIISRAQLKSIWSPTYTDHAKMDHDIQMMVALLKLNGGNLITHRHVS